MLQRLLAISIGIFFSCQVFAAVSLYEVELIAFAYKKPASGNEVWPQAVPEIDSSRAIDLTLPDGTTLPNTTYKLLPESAFSLNKEEHLLEASGKFDVLLHEAWLQPIELESLERAPRLHIATPDGKLDGTLALSRSSFFDLQTNLIYLGKNPAVQLQSTERLRINELFYLDHPYFGVLLLITPKPNLLVAG